MLKTICKCCFIPYLVHPVAKRIEAYYWVCSSGKNKVTGKQLSASGPLQIHFIRLRWDSCRHTCKVHAKKHMHSRAHEYSRLWGFHTNKNAPWESHTVAVTWGNLSLSHTLAAFTYQHLKYQSFARLNLACMYSSYEKTQRGALQGNHQTVRNTGEEVTAHCS